MLVLRFKYYVVLHATSWRDCASGLPLGGFLVIAQATMKSLSNFSVASSSLSLVSTSRTRGLRKLARLGFLSLIPAYETPIIEDRHLVLIQGEKFKIDTSRIPGYQTPECNLYEFAKALVKSRQIFL